MLDSLVIRISLIVEPLLFLSFSPQQGRDSSPKLEIPLINYFINCFGGAKESES